MSPQDLKTLETKTTPGQRYLMAREKIRIYIKELAALQGADRTAKTEEKKKPVKERFTANMLGKSATRKLELTVLYRLLLELKAEAKIHRVTKDGPVGQRMEEIWRDNYMTYVFVKTCKCCGQHTSTPEVRQRHALPKDGWGASTSKQMRESFLDNFHLREFFKT